MQKIKKQNNYLPMILVILDGWGIAKLSKGNSVFLANTPTMDGIKEKYPYTELNASGKYVGLPENHSGNSEAGHMNIGAGRIVEQDITKISKSIKDGTFFKNPAFFEAIRHVKHNNSNLHLMGMLSDGTSAHSDPDHISALIEFAKREGVKKVYLHLFTDGRDSPKYAASKLIQRFSNNSNYKKISTIMGRFYAMDRKKKWSRTEKAYNALTQAKGIYSHSAIEAITESYNREENDEFVEPYIIAKNKKDITIIQDNDSVIFFNLRSDRTRQLAKAFVQNDFNKLNPGSFKRRKVLNNLRFIAMTDFGPDLDGIFSAFPSIDLKNTLPVVLSSIKQVYIAETEKYAHVTYFFNGGYARKINGEKYFMVESPDVRSYDETPEMKSSELTKVVLNNLKKNKYDFTVLNFAAPDMIGHTGNLGAGIKCCEIIDLKLKKIISAYLKKKGTVIVTSDHGNIEEMINLKTGEIDTEHSIYPVPFILLNNELKNKIKLRKTGFLSDIAPTILELSGIKKPKEMTGRSLISKYDV